MSATMKATAGECEEAAQAFADAANRMCLDSHEVAPKDGESCIVHCIRPRGHKGYHQDDRFAWHNETHNHTREKEAEPAAARLPMPGRTGSSSKVEAGTPASAPATGEGHE